MREAGLTVDDLKRLLHSQRSASTVLWKEGYANDDAESAYAFVIDLCRTYDPSVPAGQSPVRKFPDKPYLRYLVERYYQTLKIGKPLIVEKPRRMLVSWLLRALDVWDAGRRKGSFYVACQKYPDSARMVWRSWFIYEEIRKLKPEWNLLPAMLWRYEGAQTASKVEFPNGSIMVALTGTDPDSFRQEGATRVVLEEIAFWSGLASSWANALAMVKGSAGEVGGHVVGVTTVGGQEYKEFRKFVRLSPRYIPSYIKEYLKR